MDQFDLLVKTMDMVDEALGIKPRPSLTRVWQGLAAGLNPNPEAMKNFSEELVSAGSVSLTPGPWSLSGDLIVSQNGTEIAKVLSFDNSEWARKHGLQRLFSPTRSQADANGHAIAALHELLEACKASIRRFRTLAGTEGLTAEDAHAALLLEEAIAKAEKK